MAGFYITLAFSEKWGTFQGSAHMSTGHVHVLVAEIEAGVPVSTY